MVNKTVHKKNLVYKCWTLLFFAVSRMLHFVLGWGGTCRFQPTCSQFFSEAIYHHGFLKGLYYTSARILRCHPWGGEGIDRVPGKSIFGGRA